MALQSDSFSLLSLINSFVIGAVAVVTLLLGVLQRASLGRARDMEATIAPLRTAVQGEDGQPPLREVTATAVADIRALRAQLDILAQEVSELSLRLDTLHGHYMEFLGRHFGED